MREAYNSQLLQLNQEMIYMGSMIGQAIEMATSALMKRDVVLAKQAMKYDENINNQEKNIENLCLKLLLLQQPIAKDLRYVSSALKMITDMERIGDHAADISEIILSLAENDYQTHLEYIQDMAKETTWMVINSIEAYVKEDAILAQKVIDHDDIVDELFLREKAGIIKDIEGQKENVEEATDLLMIAKYFERIGDHATNIAEWSVFSTTGEHIHGN